MTFTEAAVEVLKLASKPLHYKKITEIAIERNLLSHVGKTPEITMSARLATMVKKDRGDAPILKIKPGVFGLKEFAEDVLKTAENESGHDFELPAEELATEAAPQPDNRSSSTDHKLPGAEVFPEEDDDDDLILSASPTEEPTKKKSRRSRRKKKSDDDDSSSSEGSGRRSRSRSRERGGRSRERETVKGDWNRQRGAGEPAGRGMVSAIDDVLRTHRGGLSFKEIAERLIKKGKLSGDAASSAPTVAAAVRADIARAEAQNQRLGLRVSGGLVHLASWGVPDDADRHARDAVRSADRQRDSVRQAFIKRASSLPVAGFMELLAAWLNAEGVTELRGVRRPGSSGGTLHLAGTLRRGPEQVRLAIVVKRDGGGVGRDTIIGARGALHHYGAAQQIWLVTTGQVLSGAREEASVAGATPVALFGALDLAKAMEKRGIGLRIKQVRLSEFDFDLLEELGANFTKTAKGRRDSKDKDGDNESGESSEGSGRRKRRRKRGKDTAAADAEAAEAADTGEGDEAKAEAKDGDDADATSRDTLPTDVEPNEDNELSAAAEDSGSDASEDADNDDDDELLIGSSDDSEDADSTDSEDDEPSEEEPETAQEEDSDPLDDDVEITHDSDDGDDAS